MLQVWSIWNQFPVYYMHTFTQDWKESPPELTMSIVSISQHFPIFVTDKSANYDAFWNSDIETDCSSKPFVLNFICAILIPFASSCFLSSIVSRQAPLEDTVFVFRYFFAFFKCIYWALVLEMFPRSNNRKGRECFVIGNAKKFCCTYAVLHKVLQNVPQSAKKMRIIYNACRIVNVKYIIIKCTLLLASHINKYTTLLYNILMCVGLNNEIKKELHMKTKKCKLKGNWQE